MNPISTVQEKMLFHDLHRRIAERVAPVLFTTFQRAARVGVKKQSQSELIHTQQPTLLRNIVTVMTRLGCFESTRVGWQTSGFSILVLKPRDHRRM